MCAHGVGFGSRQRDELAGRQDSALVIVGARNKMDPKYIL